MKRYGIVLLAIGMILVPITGSVWGQEKFPTRTINIVIPFSAGGNTAINAQMLRPVLQKQLGVGVEVLLKPGGGTTIGSHYVAESAPDGYTLLGNTPSGICTQYTVKTGVSLDKFIPIIRSCALAMGVAVKYDAPWKTFKEFIAYAKANPGKITMGNSGVGAMTHIGTVGIEKGAGIKVTHMPFKGSGPVLTALVGGHISAADVELSTLYPFVEAKKVRILAVSSPKRSSIFPDVPTFKEHGFDVDIGTWVVYYAPKGTPKDRIQVLHDAFKVAIASREHKEYYEKKGGITDYMNLQETAEWVKGQDELWRGIIQYGGFKRQ